LAIGYFDKLGKFEEAGKLIEKAFSMDATDDRVFFELVQYQRNTNVDLKTRLELLEKHIDLINKDQNSFYKYISTLVENGDYKKAKDAFLSRELYQYEGGESMFVEDWIYCNLYQGKKHLDNGEIEKAIEYFVDANKVPENFNTGKGRYPHAHINYYLGLSYEKLGNSEKAKEHFEIAVKDRSMPDMNIYAGLAAEKLGDSDEAVKKYKWLLGKAKRLIENKGRYTYFTNSLVTTLPFEHDANKSDSVLAHYYSGLAYYGLKEFDKAKAEFRKCLDLKNSMYLAKEFLENWSM
jgi:tetratricopeptide (TPR) repeat protein